MTAIRAWGLILVLLFGCGASSPSPTAVVWPIAVKCGSQISDIIGIVERILLQDGTGALTPGSKQELEQLAAQYGPELVACMVSAAIQAWTAPGAAAEEQRIAAVGRGRAFLAAVGTKVEASP